LLAKTAAKIFYLTEKNSAIELAAATVL